MYDIGKQCFKSSGLRFVHVGLNLPKKVQKELNNRSKCDAKPGPGWNTLQPKKILLQQHWLQDFTSATVGLGGMGQGKEVTGPWRSGPYIGGAYTGQAESELWCAQGNCPPGLQTRGHFLRWRQSHSSRWHVSEENKTRRAIFSHEASRVLVSSSAILAPGRKSFPVLAVRSLAHLQNVSHYRFFWKKW